MSRRAALLLPLLAASALQAQARRFELSDFGREVGWSNPRLSPDGRSIAAIVSRVNYAENRFDRSVVLVDVATGAVRPLTPGRHNVGGVEWSPAGDALAFLDREGDKAAQIFVLPIAGGEARALTTVKSGVSTFAWRPDGKALAFLAEDEPVERTGDEKFNKSFEVGDGMYLEQAASLPSHLWTVPADGGTATRITSGQRSVGALAWAPDGRRIFLVVRPLPHSGELIRATTIVRDLATGAESAVTSKRGFGAPPVVSPDGRTVATVASRGPELFFHSAGVFLTPAGGGDDQLATPGIDRNVNAVRWLPDGRLLVLTSDGTRARPWIQPVGEPARRLDWGPVDPGSIDVGPGGAVVLIGEEPNRPAELYYTSSPDAAPRRLTDLNHDLAALETGRVEAISWQGPDGFQENGILIYPPGYVSGRKYPLVLNIHGGPMGSSLEGWDASNQFFAAHGWLVFSPNYRGSNNLGNRYQSAVINDAGDGPGRDVMAGIAALTARGIVDTSKMAVSGWSYGGYMTAWLTSHYQVWKAAVAGAAVTDWFDWYNLADMNTWAGFGLGGSPWRNNNAMNYWRQSPMAYAHQIRTPMLILSNTGDPRVTVTQSYKLYHALKDNGTPVQFIAYPIGGHFAGDPVHQRDVWRRWAGWIAARFAGEKP